VTIVFDDIEVFKCVCGQNDENILELGEGLGIDIFLKGNTLSIQPEHDAETVSAFSRLIDIMKELAIQGRDVDPPQIRLLIQAQKDADDFVPSEAGAIHRYPVGRGTPAAKTG